MTIILAIETSTQACSAALCIDGDVHQQFEVAPREHSNLILPMVQQVLSEQQVALEAVDYIAYGQGPGSFIGVRLATAVAQGLAYGGNKRVIGISTLRALAFKASQEHGVSQVLAGWDARMQEIYWGAYRCEADSCVAVHSDCLQAPAEVVLPEGSWLAAGNAWTVYPEELNIEGQIPELIYPDAAAVSRLAFGEIESGVAPKEAYPVYLRNKVTG